MRDDADDIPSETSQGRKVKPGFEGSDGTNDGKTGGRSSRAKVNHYSTNLTDLAVVQEGAFDLTNANKFAALTGSNSGGLVGKDLKSLQAGLYQNTSLNEASEKSQSDVRIAKAIEENEDDEYANDGFDEEENATAQAASE